MEKYDRHKKLDKSKAKLSSAFSHSSCLVPWNFGEFASVVKALEHDRGNFKGSNTIRFFFLIVCMNLVAIPLITNQTMMFK